MAGRKNGAPLSLLDDAAEAGAAGFGLGTAAEINAACSRFFARKGMIHKFGGTKFGRAAESGRSAPPSESPRDPEPRTAETLPTPNPTPSTTRTTMPTEPDQEMALCPDCGETVKRRGLGVHRARAHGYRKAAKPAPGFVPLSKLAPVLPSTKPHAADNIDSLVQRVKQAKAELDAAKAALLSALGV